jgi:hypothetical protein
MEKIKYFTILGERCTGTHFLLHAIDKNFHGLTYLKGEKHFFGNREFRDALAIPDEQMSLHEKQMKQIDDIPPEELLVISMVRHPIDWADSFFKRKHHLPPENKRSIDGFLNNEFYSIYEEGPKKGQEIMEDRNWRTKERYTNLYEMRKLKTEYMLDEVPKRYPHHWFVRYEDARDKYDETLQKLGDAFQLRRKHAHFVKIEKYKGTFNELYAKKPILLTPETQDVIWSKLDMETEQRMGYVVS